MLLIFDLDGTLIDSAEDLASAMNATREYAGMPPIDPQVIYSYVGNGAAMLVKRALGPQTSEGTCSDALHFFMRFYRQHALEHTQLYPGVHDMIEKLRTAGHTLAVLTNKPQRISTDILNGLGLGEHFVRIYGGDGLSAKKPDPIGITTLLRETAHSAALAAMIGDSAVDVETAHNAGIFACGVTWGFQPNSMTAAGPDLIINQPLELVDWVDGRSLPGRLRTQNLLPS